MKSNSPLDNLLWIEELLPHDIQSLSKHGGVAYYLDLNLVLILVESSEGSYEHKGVTYPFQIWNGCILPVQYKKQSAFFLKYAFLENHPANKDWLYIPSDSDSFEDEVKSLIKELHRRNPLLGIPMKQKPIKVTSRGTPVKATKAKPKPSKTDKKKENAFLLKITKKP